MSDTPRATTSCCRLGEDPLFTTFALFVFSSEMKFLIPTIIEEIFLPCFIR